MLVGTIVVFFLFLCFLALIFQVLWNATIKYLFKTSELAFWESVGLLTMLIIAGVVFTSVPYLTFGHAFTDTSESMTHGMNVLNESLKGIQQTIEELYSIVESLESLSVNSDSEITEDSR